MISQNKEIVKIIHILPNLQKGGAERLTIDLLKQHKKFGYKIKLILIKPSINKKWEQELKNENIEVIKLNKKHKFDIISLFKLMMILKKEKPNIVHTHLFLAHVFGKTAAKIVGVKIIIATEQNVNKNEKLIHRLLRKITSLYTSFTIAVSKEVASHTIKKEGVKKNKIKVIFNGINIRKFEYLAREYDKTDIVIGAMGRLTKQKGFKYLVDAASKINYENYKILIAGEGELRKEIESQIKKNNLEQKIQLVGAIDNTRQFYRNIDIFILPSLWEGLVIVLLEAGISRLPVISSNIESVKEIIKDNQDGLLYKVGDIDDLAKKINLLIKNSQLRRFLGGNLHETIKNDFNIINVADEYNDIYKQFFYK